MQYDPSRPLIGATGAAHKSAAEAAASFRLAPLGIVPCDAPYPVTFRDAEGTAFVGRSDFVHDATGVLFEFKASRLNGLKNKANAAKATARMKQREAQGYIDDRNRQSEMLKAGWNHALNKQAAVVAALTPAKAVLLLKDEPDEKETARLSKHGIFWRTLGNVSVFAFFLRLAASGLDVGFTASGHAFGVRAEDQTP